MKRLLWVRVLAGPLLGILATSAWGVAPPLKSEPPWELLFDGRSLQGWRQVDGQAKIEIRDGAIVGVVTPGAANTYIATEDTSFDDFILECEFRCDPGLNSGIQFRSRFADENHKRAYGYQYEIDPTPRALTAGIQEASRRSWLVPSANKGEPQESWVRIHGDLLLPGWNQARIEARGRWIRTWLNGKLMAEFEDTADVAIPRGFIGMQVHQSNDPKLFGKEVAFRSIRVQRLNAGNAAKDATSQRRQADLDLMKILSPTQPPPRGQPMNGVDKTWEEWQRRTGELPPDFATMPSQPFLPDPLAGVLSRADWPQRRRELRGQIEHWLTGRMPPPPDNLRATVTAEYREGDAGILTRHVLLEFGPDHRAKLRIEVMIPPSSQRRLPVFMTPLWRARPWAATAVARGYIGCIFHVTDSMGGEGDDSDSLIGLYPDYDFAGLARGAWAASRAIDYLITLPEVDSEKIAISGHSRNGKLVAVAAAFDERIAAVIPSSGNTGEGTPWRFTNDSFSNETMERIIEVNPHWFHPRLRFFAGREDKLPIDQNSLFALIAPRAVLLTSAYTETACSALGYEEHYRSLERVYAFLGAPDRVGLRLRAGPHATYAEDIETYLDFLDGVFGRRTPSLPRTFIRGYQFAEWQALSGESKSRPSSDPLRWALGEEPPQLPFAKGIARPDRFMVNDSWIRLLHPLPANPGMKASPVPIGVDIKGDLYLPSDRQGKKPAVIWLHPYAEATGYASNIKSRIPIPELTRRGYAVLAFDQIGYGTRIEQAKEFYRRYPHWSLLGKMVADTRAAIAAARAHEEIDPDRIYLLGYALGGKVALWAAAFDRTIAGVISVAGVTPLRTSKPAVEAIRMDSHLHGLLPRLGFYAHSPAALPFDYDDVIRAIGPRPILMVAPTHDRFADLEQLRRMVKPFSNVDLETPTDFNRFTPKTQTVVFDWLDTVAHQPSEDR